MYNVQVIDFQSTNVRAAHTMNEDGTYTIFVNARLSREQQEISFYHEIEHIQNDDLLSYMEADVLEWGRHGEDDFN